MRYEFKRRTGVLGVVNIPDSEITGDREKFITAKTAWWAKAKGVPEAQMAEILGKMWDVANPAKPTKPEAAKSKAE